MIEVDFRDDPLLENIFLNVFGNKPKLEPKTRTGPLNFAGLESHFNGATVYQYDGSLTTPPCTEKVAWNVVRQPIYISYKTYRAVKSVLKFNSRYTQNDPDQINLLDKSRNSLDNKDIHTHSSASSAFSVQDDL